MRNGHGTFHDRDDGWLMSARTTEPAVSGGSFASCPADSSLTANSAARAEALATIAREVQGPLLRFLSKRTGSPDDAKDILQEAYVRALSVDRPDSIHALDRYLWRCALNILTDRRRSLRTRERVIQALSGKPEQFAPSAEAVAEVREELALVNDVVRNLPPKCLQAFLLRVVHCLPFEDVGREMGISLRMAKIYVARTLGYLRRRLDQPDAHEGSSDRATAPLSSRARTRSSPVRQVGGRLARGCATRTVFNRTDQNRQVDHTTDVNTALVRYTSDARAAATAPPPENCS